MKVRHIHAAAADDALALAAERRETWEDAVAAYLAKRKKALQNDYATKASFDRATLRAQAKALPVLGQLITEGVLQIPETPAVIERNDGESTDDHLIRLSSLLTPPGWDAHIRPKLQAKRAEAMTAAFAEDDEENNVALIAEIDHMLYFLQAVETRGIEARATRRGKLARDTQNMRHEAAM